MSSFLAAMASDGNPLSPGGGSHESGGDQSPHGNCTGVRFQVHQLYYQRLVRQKKVQQKGWSSPSSKCSGTRSGHDDSHARVGLMLQKYFNYLSNVFSSSSLATY